MTEKKGSMTPERRREICGLIFFEEARRKGIDLRKFRRDVGTEAGELGIPVEQYQELARVAAAYALNDAIGKTVVIPWEVSTLSKDQLYRIAEEAVDARIIVGKVDLFLVIGSILKKRTPEEEKKRIEDSVEALRRINALGISTDEMLDFFEASFRRAMDLTIVKVREAIAVVAEQSSEA